MRPGTDFSLFGLADLVERTLADLVERTLADLVERTLGRARARPGRPGRQRHRRRYLLGRRRSTPAANHPALVLTPRDAFDNFLPLPIRHLQLLGRTPAGLRLLAESLRFRPVQRLPIPFGLLTRRPIPAETMASYTRPLRR